MRKSKIKGIAKEEWEKETNKCTGKRAYGIS